ncbi:hypothetical protein DKZ29_06775 [Limosilactobacillus reuteri]|uniref:Uncharacterized protein n=2 Tax=Limosilactobacillus reuteri TaxID=1598 RepID=A0A855XJU9_LIMRT|nr:hypothetical protein [Limosilactobacillus reuteri]MDY2688846.1 hypothetical protein [Limosilactobacillus reuteri]PWT34110.1 hypothetical protein DKZ21_00495 [Limosilactobacillus reuteri]PWT35310.1 hypothetical protein DKZ24_04450 [Limosilactobacillus reuteri]PWT37537.1 hypothetical protein DKZ35_04805 [Limosilactobacillus reuteri]PWT39035.1 hypothetical protein DKZ22_11900 [Limosilactobacillus reuteri]
METLATLLELVFLVSFIVAIVYGIKWFKNRNDKENDLFKKNKKRFWISIAVVVISFILGGMAQSSADDAQEQEATAQQEKKDKSNYKDDKEEFANEYFALGHKVETLSSKEGEEWNDAIENSDEDFDVDSAIDTIQNNHTDEIDDIDSKLSDLHDLDQKIQKNDSVDDSDKEKFHNAYLDVKHFANHATNISGSYNDFMDEHNDLDRKVADHVEELQDL